MVTAERAGKPSGPALQKLFSQFRSSSRGHLPGQLCYERASAREGEENERRSLDARSGFEPHGNHDLPLTLARS